MARERFYETMIVIKPTLSEEERTNLTEKVKGWITDTVDGTIEEEKRWGLRKFAYRTQKENLNEGDYTYFVYKANPEKINTLDERFHITQDIVRHLTIRREDLDKKAKSKESNITVEEPVSEENSAE
ncbi:30S ribosomal protein S6 [Geotoga petraea]|jgi:small subunit ribosomal protein S6|uniref:Small ribosomal subunit protein bS6 n=1 Tax=Geotoga petraea TaxID=28234 RepID=A0A1G6MQF3_9BACT|nr:30S ribosomal protein S6 [Geotoga petraea]TGG87380.1 30S ribosomal protein S6 [Geotoga petraea]SDC57783.1 SSU ribosomal protein S6P [Geotoga petraea]